MPARSTSDANSVSTLDRRGLSALRSESPHSRSVDVKRYPSSVASENIIRHTVMSTNATARDSGAHLPARCDWPWMSSKRQKPKAATQSSRHCSKLEWYLSHTACASAASSQADARGRLPSSFLRLRRSTTSAGASPRSATPLPRSRNACHTASASSALFQSGSRQPEVRSGMDAGAARPPCGAASTTGHAVDGRTSTRAVGGGGCWGGCISSSHLAHLRRSSFAHPHV